MKTLKLENMKTNCMNEKSLNYLKRYIYKNNYDCIDNAKVIIEYFDLEIAKNKDCIKFIIEFVECGNILKAYDFIWDRYYCVYEVREVFKDYVSKLRNLRDENKTLSNSDENKTVSIIVNSLTNDYEKVSSVDVVIENAIRIVKLFKNDNYYYSELLYDELNNKYIQMHLEKDYRLDIFKKFKNVLEKVIRYGNDTVYNVLNELYPNMDTKDSFEYKDISLDTIFIKVFNLEFIDLNLEFIDIEKEMVVNDLEKLKRILTSDKYSIIYKDK